MPDLAVVTASCRAKKVLDGLSNRELDVDPSTPANISGDGGEALVPCVFANGHITVYDLVSRSVCFILSQSRQHINVLTFLHYDDATFIMPSTATACPARLGKTTCAGVTLTGLTYHGCRRTVYKAKFVSVMIGPFSLL